MITLETVKYVLAAIPFCFLIQPVLRAQEDLIANQRWGYNRPLETIAAEGSPGGFETGLRATTDAATPATPWSSQLSLTVPAAIPAGRFLRFHLWARSPGNSRIELVHELNRDPFSKSLSYLVRLTGEWKEIALPYQSAGYAASDSALRIRTGYDVGIVELAGIRLEDSGSANTPLPPSTSIHSGGKHAMIRGANPPPSESGGCEWGRWWCTSWMRVESR